MASVSFDRSTGWWSIRYYAGPERGRVKQPLCKHPGPWSKDRPPRRKPPAVLELAAPFEDLERRARLGIESAAARTPLGPHLDAYLARKGRSWAAATRSCVGIAAAKFRAYCEARGVRTLQRVTHVVCREWIDSRLAEGARRSTVVTERSNLMPIWAEAVEDGLCDRNPWERARVPGKARREVPTAWTPAEAAALVAALEDDWLRDAVLLGLNTGIRISALLGLRWEQVDWAAGLIRVTAATSKSGRPYEVPITPTAHDVLSRRLASAGSDRGLIFPSRRAGQPFRSRTTFTRIGRAVARAGIPDHGDYNHILRRTFATIALNSGVALEVVSKCLGHATIGQTERAYAHLRTERVKQGMAGFDLPPPAQPEGGDPPPS